MEKRRERKKEKIRKNKKERKNKKKRKKEKTRKKRKTTQNSKKRAFQLSGKILCFYLGGPKCPFLTTWPKRGTPPKTL